jgi:hypothetical protein
VHLDLLDTSSVIGKIENSLGRLRGNVDTLRTSLGWFSKKIIGKPRRKLT